MAIESDISNADSRLAVQFYKKTVKQDIASDEAGRPIFKEFDFVRIMIPGDNLTEIDTYAQESHKQRFPRQWAHYQNQVANHQDIIGTPLDQWPQVSRSQAEELRGLKFHTVESIADCSDQQLQRIGMVAGMSPHNFRLKAKAFLNLANDSAEVAHREAELQALREENDKIKAETEAKLSKMESQMEALLAAVAEKTPKTRKPKVVEA
jgi:membrane protein involved in colicin uptake